MSVVFMIRKKIVLTIIKELSGGRENGISYASAGLVWKHFGEKISGSKEASGKS